MEDFATEQRGIPHWINSQLKQWSKDVIWRASIPSWRSYEVKICQNTEYLGSHGRNDDVWVHVHRLEVVFVWIDLTALGAQIKVGANRAMPTLPWCDEIIALVAGVGLDGDGGIVAIIQNDHRTVHSPAKLPITMEKNEYTLSNCRWLEEQKLKKTARFSKTRDNTSGLRSFLLWATALTVMSFICSSVE